MFQVDDSWELTSERDILRLLFNQPGLRRHPLVEVADNPPIFHLDVMFEGEAKELGFWARFLGADLATLVRFLEENDVAKSRISVQTPVSHSDEYSIRKIDKIYECCRSDGIVYYQYECMSNAHLYSKPESFNEQASDIKRIVWSALA
jgi:hypothetical protein